MAQLALGQAPVKANSFGAGHTSPLTDTLSVSTTSNVSAGSAIVVICAIVVSGAGANAEFSDVTVSDSQGNTYFHLWAIGETSGQGAYAHYPGNALFMVFGAIAQSSGPCTVSYESIVTQTPPFIDIGFKKGMAVFEISNWGSGLSGFFQDGSVQGVGGNTVTMTDTLHRTIITNAGGTGTEFDGYQNGMYVMDFVVNGVNFYIAGYLGPAVGGGTLALIPPTITTPYLYSNTDYVLVSDGSGGTIQMIVFLPGLPISLISGISCPSSSGSLGVAYSSSFSVTGGTPPYTFAITAGTLPPGLTLNTSTGAVTGIPITPGVFHYTVTATDNLGGTFTASCVITIPGTPVIPPPLQVVCSLQITAVVNQPYSSSVVASGGTPPYTFAVTSGALPTGLSLNTATGAITGTPTVTGIFNYTITVTDSAGTPVVVSQDCNLTLGTAITIVNCPDAL